MASEECYETYCNHAEQRAEFLPCWSSLFEAAVHRTREKFMVSEHPAFREGEDWKADAHLDPFQ